MCEICRKYICPVSCPSYNGSSAEFGRRLYVCQRCGQIIREYDKYKIQYGKPYCIKCSKNRGGKNEG